MLARIDPMSDMSTIGLNWRIFGSSGIKIFDDRPVMERFGCASEVSFKANKHLKRIVMDQRKPPPRQHTGLPEDWGQNKE